MCLAFLHKNRKTCLAVTTRNVSGYGHMSPVPAGEPRCRHSSHFLTLESLPARMSLPSGGQGVAHPHRRGVSPGWWSAHRATSWVSVPWSRPRLTRAPHFMFCHCLLKCFILFEYIFLLYWASYPMWLGPSPQNKQHTHSPCSGLSSKAA